MAAKIKGFACGSVNIDYENVSIFLHHCFAGNLLALCSSVGLFG